MKQAEFNEQVSTGKPIIQAEWRSGEAKTISGVSAKTGKPYVMPRIEHNVEIDGKPYTLPEVLPDGTKTEAYKLPFVKGEKVACLLGLEDNGKGVWRVTAVVSRLEK